MFRKFFYAASMSMVFVPTMANAAELPPIKASATNKVPSCATPGRLMAFLTSRNPKMNPRYDNIATEYMRHGEELGVRWDVAFFQMLVETASLKYTGDVRPKQNNFAGLGATGRGVRGESFPDVSTGVRAHLEHVLLYSGARVENPVAERTRKVQEWKVLTKWQRSLRGPITFTHLTKKWSPGDRGYSRDIKAINDLFYNGFCDRTDPRPELLAAVRGGTSSSGSGASADKSADRTKELVAKAIEKTKNESGERSALGASSIAEEKAADAKAATTNGRSIKVLNAATDNAAAQASASAKSAEKKTAALAGGALKAAGDAAAKAKKKIEKAPDTGAKTKAGAKTDAKCRVWTASYGGTKAIIIKAEGDGLTNYTVLDVNKGKEKREADAYIAAYAKGGKQIAEFDSPKKALDKAFEMCPEN